MTREVRFAAVSGCADRYGKILMSQPAKLQEPTMEEILASIRRIIAEDDLRPPPPPPPPAKPALAEAAPIPAAAESAPRHDMVDGFDDPEVSNIAANDVFEQRESPWRPEEGIGGTADAMRDPAVQDADLEVVKPAAFLDSLKFAAAQSEPAPPEPARDLPSLELPRPPRFEALRSEVAKAELAKLELARSEFARAEAAKSDSGRPDHARPDIARPDIAPKLELPKFELPRRDATRVESARPESQDSKRTDSKRADSMRPEPAKPDSMRPEPAKPPAATPPLLRAAEDGLLSPRTTAAVDLAFNTLAQTVLVQNSRTLEDLVREMLKPMLKAWLDDNLPGLVERIVRAEIERVARGRS
jgi:uncharacterized protein